MIITATPALWSALLNRPIEQRNEPAPPELIALVAQYNQASGNPAQPHLKIASAEFLNDLRAAIDELPPQVKDKLAPRLLGVFFVAGLGSSAITDVVADTNGNPLGVAVAVDMEVFSEVKANDWISWRENSPFQAVPDVRLEACIAEEAGNNRKAAMQFILLHEFGHVLAAGENYLPDWWTRPPHDADYSFLPISWEMSAAGEITPRARDDFPLRDRVVYYATPQLSGEHLPALYQDLEHTSFPTLYAATSVHEDFAECFAAYVHQVLLKQRYELKIYQDGKLVCQSGDFWQAERSHRKAAFFQSLLQRPARPISSRDVKPQGIQADMELLSRAKTSFLGLAPFLRMSIAGDGLQAFAQALLEAAVEDQDNADLWMNLATAFFALTLKEQGFSIQDQALQMQRSYLVAAAHQPARYRLLMLMENGDLAANTPLDCLLENGHTDLIYYYATAAAPLPAPLPAHDAIVVAFAENANTQAILQRLEPLLDHWHKPVINAPQSIPNTERCAVSNLLQGIPGLLMPPIRQIGRADLQAISLGAERLSTVFPGCRFPIIVRPVGSQAGRDLAKIDNASEIADYLAKVAGEDFYLSIFIDYSGADGLFRKYRIALIDGRPFACHMGISSHWMVHYVNAGMYEVASKRAEEAAFMANFAAFAQRHGAALTTMYQRMQMDYLLIDCAETQAGELLIFESDHGMVVHAMDPEDLFPYKQSQIETVKRAFEDYLGRLCNGTGRRPD